ncbi:hypothetical protein KO116_P200065 (plasmid) [Halomonas sp. KO116]|jgi:hypothetical protein|nr:hypothetical protein KO116_P200065 [Halomonas sp. KO116]EHA15275.1 hypothetical protein HAL1_12189 [Halomonas sp. HAL1]
MKELLFLCIGSLLLFLMIKDGRKSFSKKPPKKIKLDEFKDRPPLTWTGRDKSNPLDTDLK